MLKVGLLIMVNWEDSRMMPAGWKFVEDLPSKHPLMTSVGYLVAKNKKYLTIAPHIDDNVQENNLRCSGEMMIPLSCIIKIQKLIIKKKIK